MTGFHIFMTIATGAFIIFSAWAFHRMNKLEEDRIKRIYNMDVDNDDYNDICDCKCRKKHHKQS